MPFKYIGRTHDFKGKSLWEILGNLKNLGVGRIVTRSKNNRYPEPSYMKILKVETLPQPENESLDNLRKVRVLVENTFRGKTSRPTLIESVSYKTDYVLIPKDQEAEFCKKTSQSETKRILPRTMDFPPLLKELLIRDAKSKGEVAKEDLQLEIAYNKHSRNNKYKIADEGEEPTETITIGLGVPKAPRLFKGIDL